MNWHRLMVRTALPDRPVFEKPTLAAIEKSRLTCAEIALPCGPAGCAARRGQTGSESSVRVARVELFMNDRDGLDQDIGDEACDERPSAVTGDDDLS